MRYSGIALYLLPAGKLSLQDIDSSSRMQLMNVPVRPVHLIQLQAGRGPPLPGLGLKAGQGLRKTVNLE